MYVASTPFFDNAVTGAVAVKATRGMIHGLRLVNTTAAVAYLQVFDKPAADVVLGTTAPKFAVRLGANEAILWPIEMAIDVGGTGISVAGTTTPTGNTTAAISVLLLVE
jgi:hypothetical protein